MNLVGIVLMVVPSTDECPVWPANNHDIHTSDLCIKKFRSVLYDAGEIVLSHQERYDGGGYPQSLAGDEIPVGARVFAVADAMDAITTDRPYRVASSFEDAQAEIARWAGSQFDPAVVEVFLGVSTETWIQIRQ